MLKNCRFTMKIHRIVLSCVALSACAAQQANDQSNNTQTAGVQSTNNQAVIMSLSPQSGTAKAKSQDVTIFGRNFICKPVPPHVYFNGKDLNQNQIACHDMGSITVSLDSDQLSSTGDFQLIVQNVGGARSQAANFSVTETGVPGVDLVLGIGALITGEDTSYKINSTANVLEGSFIGRTTPQLLAGVAFGIPVLSIKNHPTSAFVSLKFATNTSDTLDGFVFGLSHRIASHLSVLIGLSLTPFDEPSQGFKSAAINAVQTNPSAYPGFNVAALEANSDNPGAFDCFPLLKQPLPSGTAATANANLYPGDPLERQYRAGILIGISIPLSLDSLFRKSPQGSASSSSSGAGY